jgi:hypothetical protein
MAFGGAKTRPRIGKRIKDTQNREQQLFSLFRRTNTPSQIQVPFFAGDGGGSNAPGADGNFLKTAGGTMIGPIAFFPVLIEIENGEIDIGISTDEFSGRALINAETGTTDNLLTITGAEHAGQILILQGTVTETITIKHATGSGTAWVISTAYALDDIVESGGNLYVCKVAHTSAATDEPGVGGTWETKWFKANIRSAAGADIVLNGNDNLLLVFDVTQSQWTNISPISDLAASGSGANTALSNLISTQINQGLMPDTDDTYDLGATGKTWKHLWANLIRFPNQESIPTNFVGIVKDTNDDLNLNVPTGEQFQLSVNGVAKHTFSATQYTGINIILSDVLTFNDSTADPSANGQMQRNSTDVKVYSGGAVRNLSDIGAAGGANVNLSNLTAVAVNADVDPDSPGTRDLGDGTNYWGDMYAQKLNLFTAGVVGTDTGIARNTDDVFVNHPASSGTFSVREAGTAYATFSLVGTDPLLQIFGGSTQTLSLDTGGNRGEILFNGTDVIINRVSGGTGNGIRLQSAGSTGLIVTSDSVDFFDPLDLNANDITEVNDLSSNSSGNISGFVNVDVTALRRNADPTNINITSAASGWTYSAALGDTHSFEIGGAPKMSVSETSVTLTSGIPLLVNDSLFITHISDAFIEISDIAVPSNAPSGFARIFHDSADDTLKVIKSTGGAISLEGGGGASFPIIPTVNDHGTIGSVTESIVLNSTDSHIHKMTLNGDVTFAFNNPPTTGTQIEFELEILQDATGGRLVTFPASLVETVNIDTSPNALTIITLRTNDGGTNYHAVTTLAGTISAGSQFANTTLSNLGTTTINTSLISDTDDTDSLGASGKSWKDLWINLVRFPNQETIPTNFVGIVKDTNDDLNLNVPTGEQIQLSFNGVAKHTFTGTQYTGINLILSDTLTLNDSVTDPTGAGEFTRNSADVKVFSGGAVRNLSNMVTNPIPASFLPATDTVYDLGATTASWVNLYLQGQIIFDGATASQFIQTSPTQMRFELPTGDEFNWEVNNLDQMTLTSADLDIHGNTLSGLTSLNFDDGNTIATTPTQFIMTLPTLTDDFLMQFGGNLSFQVSQNGILSIENSVNATQLDINIRKIEAGAAAAGILADINFVGLTDSDVIDAYAVIRARQKSVTNGSQYGGIELRATTGSSEITVFEIDGNASLGRLGFYGTAPIAKQTGVTVDAAGIHAALVNLGLIT